MFMKRLYILLALAAILASCSVSIDCDDSINNPKGSNTDINPRIITEVISGSHGFSTKASIADTDGAFAWTAGDNIAVHVSKGDDHKYVFTSGEGGASVAAATADFSVSYDEGYTRDAFAVYPSTIVSASASNYGQSGASLDVTLPGSYTLAQVTGETTPCPMIATNTAGSDWTFYQLCGLLRLTVNGIPSSSKRLEISFDGKNVAGKFAIPSPVKGDGSSKIALTDASGDNSSVITITKDDSDKTLGVTSLVANIPLPVGTYTTFTVTAYDALTGGNVTLTLTRPFAYTASNLNGTKRTASSPSSKTAFRGYEVSAGILERTKSGDAEATYSLTSGAMFLTADPVTGAEYYSLPAGCNPFEPAVYYGKAASLNTYFNQWGTLKTELGADGNNIKATSDKLPAGWRFPSAGGTIHSTGTDWGNILFGAPKSAITVNGNTVSSNAYAVVTVTLKAENPYSVAAGDYYGLLLLRDGATISAEHLTQLGYDHTYADNQLTQDEFGELVKLGCLFISASGLYHNERGWEELSSYWKGGFYWSNIYYSENKYLIFKFDQNGAYVSANSGSNSSQREYKVVKLVKPVTD